jgi:hypothetical protein
MGALVIVRQSISPQKYPPTHSLFPPNYRCNHANDNINNLSPPPPKPPQPPHPKLHFLIPNPPPETRPIRKRQKAKSNGETRGGRLGRRMRTRRSKLRARRWRKKTRDENMVGICSPTAIYLTDVLTGIALLRSTARNEALINRSAIVRIRLGRLHRPTQSQIPSFL